jgi:hypothetical protein
MRRGTLGTQQVFDNQPRRRHTLGVSGRVASRIEEFLQRSRDAIGGGNATERDVWRKI